MLLICSRRFEEHVTPPGHPERLERAQVFNSVAQRWVQAGGRTAAARPATREELSRVHDPGYIDGIEGIAGRAVKTRRGHLHLAGIGGDRRPRGGRRRAGRRARPEQP